MRKKLAAAAAITAMMCVLPGWGVLAEVADTMTTKVSIRFFEADYFYDFPDGVGKGIGLGGEMLTRTTIQEGNADGDEYILRVCGRRVKAGRWRVDVEKSPGVGLSTSGDGSNRDQPSCTETVIWTLTLMP